MNDSRKPWTTLRVWSNLCSRVSHEIATMVALLDVDDEHSPTL